MGRLGSICQHGRGRGSALAALPCWFLPARFPATHAKYLIGSSVAAQMGAAGNLIGTKLVRTPSACLGRGPARTIKNPFREAPARDREQIRAVTVGAESDQVSSSASGTLHAMTDAPRHESPVPRGYPTGAAHLGRKRTSLDKDGRFRTSARLA